ncbi:MAG: flagellar protein [Lachnospiraceae bacterium]|nr:flagellar protein [Lachnospiraceae bacterium]MCR5268977.1 flagellar protein [Lachnospiraceae bacterium]
MQEGREYLSFDIPVTCEECGGRMIFKGVGEYACEQCGALAYDDYGKVRNYIEQHPGAMQSEVSAATGVSKAKIRQLLIEERIEVTPDSPIFLHCAICGADIRSGMYCPACAQKVKQDELHVAKVVREKQRKMGYASEANRDAKGRRRFERK